MKIFGLLLITALSFTAQAQEEKDVEGDLNKCLAQVTDVTDVQSRRNCIDACYEVAGSTMEINICASTALQIEQTEYNRVLDASIAGLRNAIDDPEDAFLAEEFKEILTRLSKYNSQLSNYIEAKCSVEGIQMLNGSAEGAAVMGCTSRSYKEATQFILEYANYSN